MNSSGSRRGGRTRQENIFWVIPGKKKRSDSPRTASVLSSGFLSYMSEGQGDASGI